MNAAVLRTAVKIDHRSSFRCLWIGLLLACVAPVCLQANPDELSVEIVQPAVGQPLFDQVTISLHLQGTAEVDRVEVRVDGELAGTLRRPPWQLEVDVGSENRKRRIAVQAFGRHGEVARAQLVAPAVQVHDAMDLDLQQLYLTVTRRGERVVDVDRAALTLRDDGRRQEIVTWAGGEIPFTAVVLVDASNSMTGGPLEAALRGARRFVSGMQKHDEARVLVTSDRVLKSSPWGGPLNDTDAATFASSLQPQQAEGGSAILDHLYMALELLESRQGRRVLVLLSDGHDQHSHLTAQQVQEVARQSQAMIYWVRLGGDNDVSLRGRSQTAWTSGSSGRVQMLRYPLSTWRDKGLMNTIQHTLEDAVELSGGRILPVSTWRGIEPAFADILDELRQQIAIGYYPEPRRDDGSWRPVKVRLKGRGLSVRTRQGYVDRP